MKKTRPLLILGTGDKLIELSSLVYCKRNKFLILVHVLNQLLNIGIRNVFHSEPDIFHLGLCHLWLEIS